MTTLNDTTAPVTRRRRRLAAKTATPVRRPETLTITWESRAACFNRPEEWWDGDKPADTEKARTACLGCPVLEDCLTERMRAEDGQVTDRYLVRGALTGPQRVQLYVEDPSLSGWDAEEARLIALEARAYGRTAEVVAPEGTAVGTVRLAGRLAGESVPIVTTVLSGGSALRKALAQAGEIMRRREGGESVDAITKQLGLRKAGVEDVVRLYQGSKPVPRTPAELAAAREAWLAGDASVFLTVEERLDVIRREVLAGRQYFEIDDRRGVARGVTQSFVSRKRRAAEARGEVFPIPHRDQLRRGNVGKAA